MPDVVASRYRILSPLGAGGMGEVFRAEDTRLRRLVALKRLKRCGANEEALRARLLREARAASALTHPGIAVVYEVGDDFIAMEFVEGKTLAALLADGPLPAAEAVRIVRTVAEALADAHARGVIHRDVKPSNLMVTPEGRVKILDFGLARHAPPPAESETTWSGVLVEPEGVVAGTLSYMSPEQVRGREVDGRTDVYSLGVVLYETLSGRRPFRGANAIETVDAILHDEPDLFEGASVPEGHRRVVARMLAKDPAARYATMAECAADLAALERGETLAPARPSASSGSVAVLGFTNITGRAEDDWLGTGVAETLSADLKGVAGLTVVSRERVVEVIRKLRAEGRADDETLAASLGREVGARWVVQGGVQRVGETVRLTASLTEVSLGAVVATAKADGTLAGIFELQDRLVRELTAGVVPRVSPASGEGEETHVLEAYEAFSKGMINLRAETRESLDRAILFFERATALDPSYAHAHQQLGTAYDLKAGSLSMAELFEKAIASFRRAIELRPSFSEAWREMGSSLLSLGRDDEALAAIRHALELDPTNPGAHASLARTFFIGKAMFREAAEEFEKALALNPQAGWYWLQLAHVSILLREFPKAERAARRAIQLQEEFLSGKEGILSVGGYLRLGQIAALEGRYSDAAAEFERERDFLRRVDHALRERTMIEVQVRLASALKKLGKAERARTEIRAALEGFDARLALGADEPFTRYYAAMGLALLGEDEKALDSLQAAAAKRPRFTTERARIEPDFETLRGNPRFRALLGGA